MQQPGRRGRFLGRLEPGAGEDVQGMDWARGLGSAGLAADGLVSL